VPAQAGNVPVTSAMITSRGYGQQHAGLTKAQDCARLASIRIKGRIEMMRKTLLLSLAAVVLSAGACAAPPVQPIPAGKPIPSQSLPATVTDQTAAQERLPEPIIAGNSVELCLYSRYSEHSLSGTASNPQLFQRSERQQCLCDQLQKRSLL
jgi:hypothetical protein